MVNLAGGVCVVGDGAVCRRKGSTEGGKETTVGGVDDEREGCAAEELEDSANDQKKSTTVKVNTAEITVSLLRSRMLGGPKAYVLAFPDPSAPRHVISWQARGVNAMIRPANALDRLLAIGPRTIELHANIQRRGIGIFVGPRLVAVGVLVYPLDGGRVEGNGGIGAAIIHRVFGGSVGGHCCGCLDWPNSNYRGWI